MNITTELNELLATPQKLSGEHILDKIVAFQVSNDKF